MRKLDRNRYYAHIYGDDERRYYQDGIHFNGAGDAVDSDRKPAPASSEEQVKVVDNDQKLADSKRAEKLNELHISKIKEMATKVEEATGVKAPEMSGAGVKKRLIEYIVANTDE